MTIKEIIINSYMKKSAKLKLSAPQKTDLLFDITLEFITNNQWQYVPEGSVNSADIILGLENPYAIGVNCFNLSDIFNTLCKEIGFDDADRFEYKYKPTSKIGQPLYEQNSKSKYRIQCFDEQYPFTDNQVCFDQHCVTKVNNRFYDLVFSCSYKQEDAPYDIGPFAELVSYLRSNNEAEALRILSTSNEIDLKKTFDGNSLLHFAAISGSVKICTYLLSKNADANKQAKFKEVPLEYVSDNDSELFKLLSKHTNPVTVEIIKKNNIANLHFSNAVKIIKANGSIKAFSEEIQNIDIDFIDGDGKSLLHHAAASTNLDIVKELLARGANANLSDAISYVPLHYAVNGELIALLSNKTAPLIVDNVNMVMMERFYAAAKIIEDNRSIDEFSEAIQYINIHCTGARGWSLLHYAAHYNNLDIAKLLLDKGANANLKNNDSRAPIHYAGENNSPMYQLLAPKTDKAIIEPSTEVTDLKSTGSLASIHETEESNKLLAPKTDKMIIEPSPEVTDLKSTEPLAPTHETYENNKLLEPKNDKAIIEPPPKKADLTKELSSPHSLNEPKLDLRNINNTPRTPESNYSPPKKTNPSSINISMQILGGFMAVVGSAAIATAFILLNASTLGLAGLVTAGVGAASLAAGIGLFGTYNHKQAKVNEYNEAMASLAF